MTVENGMPMTIGSLYAENGPRTNLMDKIAESTSKLRYQAHQSVHHPQARQRYPITCQNMKADSRIPVDILDFVILNILLLLRLTRAHNRKSKELTLARGSMHHHM